MRIAVYAIALNEIQHVARFLTSCREADLVLVADTGSTDGTFGALQAHGAVVHRINVDPWRFDDARNAALSLLPTDIQACVSLDMDEVLNSGWRTALERRWTRGTTRARYRYIWSHNTDGSPSVEYVQDKIHARHGYRWRHPCHEALYPDRLTECFTDVEHLRVDHWPDPTKLRNQYLPLLELAVREDPLDPRCAHFLGREYLYHGRYQQAERELKRHLTLPDAHWDVESCASMRYIAKCRLAVGDFAGAAGWLLRATATAPGLRDPWTDLAEVLYFVRDWHGCFAASSRAISISASPSNYASDPRCKGPLPYDLASIAAFELGMHDVALQNAEMAATIDPSDDRLRANVTHIRAQLQTARHPQVTQRGALIHESSSL